MLEGINEFMYDLYLPEMDTRLELLCNGYRVTALTSGGSNFSNSVFFLLRKRGIFHVSADKQFLLAYD